MSFQMMNFSRSKPGSGIAGSYDTCIFSIQGNSCCFPQWLHHLHSHQDCRRIPFSVHPVQYLFFVELFDDGHCDQCEVILHCNFDLHWLNNSWCGVSFHVLLLFYTLWVQFTFWIWLAETGLCLNFFSDDLPQGTSFTAPLDFWLLRAYQHLFYVYLLICTT